MTEGTARVVRRSAAWRAGAAAAVGLAGLVLGAASVLVPIVHLISVWAVPLLALGVGAYVWTLRLAVREIEGTCAACGAAVVHPGGEHDDPMFIRCAACGDPLEVRVPSHSV